MSDDVHAARSSLTRKTMIGAAWLLLWRFVARSLGFVSTLVLARVLVPADFGLVAMATTFSYAVEALSQLGLQDALVRRREEGMDLHSTAFTLQLGRAAVTALVVAAGAPVAAWWFAEPRLQPVVLVLAGVTLLNGLENVGMAEYRRAMRFDVQFRLNVLTRLAGFFVTIASALIWQSYWALLAGIVIAAAARVGMTYSMHPFRPRLRLTRWRELAHFSLWTWATAVVSLIWERCDPFVIGPKLGSARMGLYLLAADVGTLPITEVVVPASDALFTSFANLQKTGASSIRYAPEVAGIVLMAVAPLILGMSASAGPLVEVLLGPKWAEAWPVVSVITWASVFAPYSFICSMALVANNHLRRNFTANVIVSAFKLAATMTLISLTTDLVVIGATAAGCVAVEALVFLTVLRGTGEIKLRPAVGGLTRIVVALVVAAAVIGWLDIGWQAGTGSLASNLTRGCLVGTVAVGMFWATLLALWQAAGRPKGQEARLFQLIGPQVAKLRASRWMGSAG